MFHDPSKSISTNKEKHKEHGPYTETELSLTPCQKGDQLIKKLTLKLQKITVSLIIHIL